MAAATAGICVGISSHPGQTDLEVAEILLPQLHLLLHALHLLWLEGLSQALVGLQHTASPAGAGRQATVQAPMSKRMHE
jgi:hypothetical protein